ncbi:hypothetical protein [Nocardia nepalensis]|uniref:hypothetical protein n=1 Tax=Nocardia nepalensis TaxID=3375448 RepID=UPI003B6741CB
MLSFSENESLCGIATFECIPTVGSLPPVGASPLQILTTLRAIVTVLTGRDDTKATELLNAISPVPAGQDDTGVAGSIGVGTSLLDDWLSGRAPETPKGLATAVRLPRGHWTGERAATYLLALARNTAPSPKQDAVIANHGGLHVLYGTALALTGPIHTWAQLTNTLVTELTNTHIA